MKIDLITYKGQQILYSDYSGLSEAEMIKQLRQETEAILKQKADVLYLANFTDTVISAEFMRIVNEDGKKTKNIVKKSAIVGVSGMKSVLLNSFNMISGIKARAFSDLTKAKDYLTAS